MLQKTNLTSNSEFVQMRLIAVHVSKLCKHEPTVRTLMGNYRHKMYIP